MCAVHSLKRRSLYFAWEADLVSHQDMLGGDDDWANVDTDRGLSRARYETFLLTFVLLVFCVRS